MAGRPGGSALSEPRRGKARQGEARRGKARQGEARRGKPRQGLRTGGVPFPPVSFLDKRMGFGQKDGRMAVGVTDRVWMTEDLVELMDPN